MTMKYAFAIVLLASTAGLALAQEADDPSLRTPDDPILQEPLPEPGQPEDPTTQEGVTRQELPPPPTNEKIKNRVAEFSGLDKITGRTITFDVYIDETVQFGTLQVTPRICYSRPVTETPKTDAFVEVDEITLDRDIRRIFTGWMFADSPGLNAIEHPIYDVWLKDCKMESDVAPPTSQAQ